MTENLLLKLEEKTMLMLSEVEELRKQVQRLTQENSTLRADEEIRKMKLQDLIAMLDSVTVSDHTALSSYANVASKPTLVQG